MKRNILLTGLLFGLTASSFGEKTAQKPETPPKEFITERPKVDTPVVIICKNRWGQYHLCVFFESRTIALKVNHNVINAYFSKRISLRRVFILADAWFDMDGVMEEMKKDNTLFPEEFYHKDFKNGFLEHKNMHPFINYISCRCTLDVLPWLGIVQKEKPIFVPEKRRKFQRGRKR